MKDPAFPFYAQDFLTGVMHFTMPERGLFITLLSYQWSHGSIPQDRLGLILGSGWEAHWPAVSKKFVPAAPGFIANARLEEERAKRAQFKLKQSENGKKGGRKPKSNATDKPQQSQNTSQLSSQKKPLENESDTEDEYAYEIVNEDKETHGVVILHEAVALPYTTDSFAQQWHLWKSYRARQHNFSYYSPATEQAALNELAALATGEDNAIAILHQSMAKGWKGFFEIKQNHERTKPAAKGKVQYSDEFKRKIAGRLQSG